MSSPCWDPYPPDSKEVSDRLSSRWAGLSRSRSRRGAFEKLACVDCRDASSSKVSGSKSTTVSDGVSSPQQ